MFLRSIKLTNLLSFGPDSEPVPLGPLNVLIGPNGSGKSNLLQALALLRDTPEDLTYEIREGGGIREWLWKGSRKPQPATIEAIFHDEAAWSRALRYRLSFTEVGGRTEVVDERVESAEPPQASAEPELLFGYVNGRPMLRVGEQLRELLRTDVNPHLSILAQRRDPDLYPEVTRLGESLGEIRTYRTWWFGPQDARTLGTTDDPSHFLVEGAFNLGLVINQIRKHPELKARFLQLTRLVLEGVEDVDVDVGRGNAHVFIQERGWIIPVTRLSDGTLRWLSLLTILLNPSPQRLICIEEPELGLHPDLLPALADLLREAAEQTQLIVTTHSDILVDALNETPEAVLVCEKHEGATQVRRLERAQLAAWLEKYTLGELWRSGELGGTRW